MTLTRLVAEGDSITYDQGSPPESYARAWKTANAGVATTISSNVGSGIGAAGDAAGSNSMYGRKGDVIAAAPQVQTILIGANDLVNGYANEAAWRAALFGYIAYMKGQLPSVTPSGLVVGVAGVMPQGIGPYHGEASRAEFHARALGACRNLRAAVGNQVDFYIPVGDAMDPDWVADPNNLYDGIHPGNNGKRLMGAIYTAVMDPILSRATGTDPAAFAVIDQHNAVANSFVEQAFIVTGLGLGQRQTFAATNGVVARGRIGNPAFEPSVVAMNGDLIRWRVRAPATAGATVTSTLSAGGRSAMFAVRTMPAAGSVGFASGPIAPALTRAASGAPFEFTRVAFPAGRPLVALDMSYNLSSSVTMTPSGGGASITLTRVGDNGPRQQVWIAAAGVDLAAGDYDVTVTTSYNQDCILFPAAVRNCRAAAGGITLRRVTRANRPMGDNPSESVLTVPHGAISVGFAITEAAGAASFPDATVERSYPATPDTQFGNDVSVRGAWVVSGVSRNPAIAGVAASGQGNRVMAMITLLLEP